MTEQAEELTRGDALARVAVLEAEAAELRKRACVPEGCVPVPSVVVEFLKGAGQLEGLWFGQSSIDRGAFWWRKYLFAISAAPAPVERVEQEAVAPPVAWQHRKPIISDIHGNAKEWSDWIDGQGLAIWPHRPLYAAPQPAAPAQHSDDQAVDRFASAMKAKLAAARAKGRSGWDDPTACSVEYLAQLLREHLTKGNHGTFEDVANFCMMLHQRGADPTVLAAPAPDVAGLVEALQLFVRWVDMEQSENVTAGVFDRLKAFRNAESKARAVLAAHQSGGAKS